MINFIFWKSRLFYLVKFMLDLLVKVVCSVDFLSYLDCRLETLLSLTRLHGVELRARLKTNISVSFNFLAKDSLKSLNFIFNVKFLDYSNSRVGIFLTFSM